MGTILQTAEAAKSDSVFALIVLAGVLAIAVYVELKENRIPNWLTLSGMFLGLLIGYSHGMSVFWSSLGGLVIGFGFLFLFYVFGGVGGGDVKMMGAAGALMGQDLIKPALFYTALVGALMAILILIWRKDFWLRVRNALRRLAFWRPTQAKGLDDLTPTTVPYGLAIAIGCLLAIMLRNGS